MIYKSIYYVVNRIQLLSRRRGSCVISDMQIANEF